MILVLCISISKKFSVPESRNTAEKIMCKSEAKGREFMIVTVQCDLLRQCSCSRELGIQATDFTLEPFIEGKIVFNNGSGEKFVENGHKS